MNTQATEHRCGEPVYLYAIVPSGPDGHGLIPGMEAIAGPVSTIDGGPYSAVVGGSPGYSLKGRSRDELARLLVAHQTVIETLMRTASVLPVKFGTQAPDELGVQEVLARGCPLFDSAFSELKGCTQFEVLVTWEIGAVFANIAIEEPIAHLKGQIAAGPDVATVAHREALGKLVKDALERRRVAVATDVLDTLRTIASDSIVAPAEDDRVVLHVVLLLKVNALDDFERRIEKLDSAYGGRLGFRCVGPMPPASFATVEIEFLEAAEVEDASHVLNVDLPASVEDVRAAYYRLALAAHPDTTAAQDNGTARMAALSDAYKFLSRYVRAREGSGNGSSPSTLESDHAARAVLVTVRRQDAESGPTAPDH